ncbi:AAA family ATPase [Methanorbis furvi]|uniref:ATPase AAA-type core domain-containing protein n=1 Tax=Methanorbis furvi TaxID=3028299 RepID=A0AAE4SAC4_9EURY|nr:hypothetical protein [Methanocorpusculaceae archaeon Ag1]
MIAQQLTKISIEGFRSIEKIDIPLDRINLLIGPNGSGKSNVLSIFELLHAVTLGRLQKFVEENGGAEILFRYGTGRTEKVRITAEFGDSFYEVVLTADKENHCRIESEQLILAAGEKTLTLRSRDTLETGVFTRVDEHPSCESFRLHLQSWTIYRFKQRCTNHDDDKLVRFLHMLKTTEPDHYDKIVDTVRLVFPQFGDFVFKENGDTPSIYWMDKNSEGYAFPFSALSGGTARFVALAVLLIQPCPPKLILIDEPELGLHPFAVAALADLIKFAGEKSQLIVSTQSVQLLNAFDPETEDAEGCSILIVENHNGATTLTLTTPESLADWIEEYSIGELWQMNILGGNP